MRLQHIALFCAATSLCVGFSSCGVSAHSLNLQPTPILSGGSGWAIVSDSYIRLKASPAIAAADVADLRDGSEAEILGREVGKDSSGGRSLWYKIRVSEPGEKPLEGWVLESEIDLYDSKVQADRALRAKSGK
jgi:hypothetical protein